jgi:N-acetylmuramoyl-L-alanine amidase
MNDPIDTMARTAWGEARGEGDAGITAVCWVIKNRAARPGWWGKDIVGVCYARAQFSCWLPSDPNSSKIVAVTERDPVFARCLKIADDVFFGRVPDTTGGATFYHTLNCHPNWASAYRETVRIGHHIFYSDEKEVA